MTKQLLKLHVPFLFAASLTLYVGASFANTKPGDKRSTTQNAASAAFKKVNTLQITGRVTDASTSETLPGVTISIKGTGGGTVTNGNGRYNISADEKDVLVFSYIGYTSQEIAINGQAVLNVQLKADSGSINEVVVVGYGTQRKTSVTGAVSSITAAKIKDFAVTTFENAIVGQIAGVQVQEPSGEPGSAPTIRVRGVGSISAGNEPLYVIDGFPVSKNVDPGVQGDPKNRTVAFRPQPSNPLGTISPGDIESIEVLKDASAAAIYGSRGSNGVVLITTKRGTKDGQPNITVNSYLGVQQVARKVKLLNATELTAYVKDARNNAYLQDVVGALASDGNTTRATKAGAAGLTASNYYIPDDFVNPTGTNTDWQDELFKLAPIQSHTISSAGGTDKFGYYVSGNFFNQDGIIDNTGFKRYSLRVNLDAQPLKHLKIGVSINPSFTDQQRGSTSAPYFADPPGAVYTALVTSPTVSPYLPDGSINQSDNQSHLFTETGLSAGMTASSNPLAVVNYIHDNLQQFRSFTSAFAEYEILKGFKYKLYAGADINNYNKDYYRERAFRDRDATVGVPLGQSNKSLETNWLVENTLSFEKKFGDHYLSTVAGYTAQKDNTSLNQVTAENYPDDLVQTVSGGQVTGGTSIKEQWSLVSYLARANYSFKDRYLFSASIRADEASRFGKNNRTGVFPSFSAGWRIIEEPFAKNINFLSDLKLRGSWGKTGNFLIPNYASIGLLNPYNYVFGNAIANGLAPSTPTNNALTWEKNTQTDVGLDIGLLKNRIFASIDIYRKITSDLLLNVQVPAVVGLGTQNPLQNIGEVENKGIELAISTQNLVGAFTWRTDVNVSANRNKVLKLGITGDPILGTSGDGTNRHITRIGDAVGSYYGYVVDGIYQNQADIAKAPVDKISTKASPGDFRFKDVNGDGIIDANDRTVIGNYQPDFTYGITNRFGYKGVELSFLIQGVQGSEILNLTRRHLASGEALTNAYALEKDRWISESQPGNGKVPRAYKQSTTHNFNNRNSDYQVEDGSYVRLRNITLGYTFPANTIAKHFPALRLYASGNNLVTISKYVGYNPEVNNQSTTNTTPGEDYGAYPLTRNYTLGINVVFK